MADTQYSFLSLDDSRTSANLQHIARKNLGETEELKDQCLQQLRILIKDNKLTCISTDDFLLRFLRAKKFDIQRSLEMLRNYVPRRTVLHKNLLELQPEVLERCFRLNMYGVLPYTDSEERLICHFRTALWDLNVCSVKELATGISILSNLVSEKESSQISGMVWLVHLELTHFSHLPQIISLFFRMKDFLLNSVPVRYSRIHVISSFALFKHIFALLSPFLPKKLRERIVLHAETRETLFEHLPRGILPDVFGGTMGPLDQSQLIEVIKDHRQKMIDEYHYFHADI